MSYSYIKNVFPNFESSLQDATAVYNAVVEPFDAAPAPAPGKAPPRPSPQVSPAQKATGLDYSSPKRLLDVVDTHTPSPTCHAIVQHALDCQACANVITKQLQLNHYTLLTEEVLELVSYVLFGIFVLVVLDYIARR